jgi:hypothetical protein
VLSDVESWTPTFVGVTIEREGRWISPRNENAPILLDLASSTAYLPLASWPDGRLLITRERQREESPGSAETGCRVTPGGGDPRDSATENEPPGIRPGQG